MGQPWSLAFWQRLKSRQGSGNALEQGKGRLPVCPDWRLWTRGSWKTGTGSKVSSVIDDRCIFGFLWFVLEGRDKNSGNGQLLIQSWPFVANFYRSYYSDS